MLAYELTTGAGVTVEKVDHPDNLVFGEHGVSFLALDGTLNAFFSYNHIVSVGRITEEEYDAFRAETEQPDEEVDTDEDASYRKHLEGFLNG